MKILHVIDTMDLARGGPPQVCANLVTQQAKSHDIGLVTYSDEVTNRNAIPGVGFENHTVDSTSFGEKFLGSQSRKKFNTLTSSFDVVHLHNVWESILVSAARFADENSIPYVITPHGMLDPWCMSQKAWKKRLALTLGRRTMIENAKFIHALNPIERSGIRSLGIQNRCEIIANGISLETTDQWLTKSEFESGYPELAGKPFVLFLSRLHFKKGLDILAKAAVKFFANHPNWQLVVAGPDDGAKEDFEASIKSSGIDSQVHLLGPIFGSMKYSLLASCEIFCLPSRQEGFSIAILEAMAAAKPVAITTGCHFDEVGTSRCGLVEELDPDLLAKSLCKLADSESLRTEMGKNARHLIEQKYTWHSINELLVSHYVD